MTKRQSRRRVFAHADSRSLFGPQRLAKCQMFISLPPLAASLRPTMRLFAHLQRSALPANS